MPFHEVDPWRLQYFAAVDCPPDVHIPTEDSDAWLWNPTHRWVYDKLRVAESQGLEAAPHGVVPQHFPVFSKPIVNLHGMGAGSRTIQDLADYERSKTAGHFWTTLLAGEHVSSDAALLPVKNSMIGCTAHWGLMSRTRLAMTSTLGRPTSPASA